MPIAAPAPAVTAARARRAGAAAAGDARIQWFIREVSDKITMTMEQRVKLATEHLRDRVVRNISRPVTKGTGPRGGRVVVDRSKPGEFPKADTTQLMKSIFGETRRQDGYVGTTLDYGLILEVSERLNRSFLVRTLSDETPTIKRILTGPIR